MYYITTSEIDLELNNLTCPRKWDEFFCWPTTLINTRVAIPCNASKIFVETVEKYIPGKLISCF